MANAADANAASQRGDGSRYQTELLYGFSFA